MDNLKFIRYDYESVYNDMLEVIEMVSISSSSNEEISFHRKALSEFCKWSFKINLANMIVPTFEELNKHNFISGSHMRASADEIKMVKEANKHKEKFNEIINKENALYSNDLKIYNKHYRHYLDDIISLLVEKPMNHYIFNNKKVDVEKYYIEIANILRDYTFNI